MPNLATDLARVILLNCPFCNRQPTSKWHGVLAGGMNDDGYWGIDCCFVHVHEDTEEAAAAIWNTRAASGGDSASLEQRARELLAREYEGHGYADYARYIRSGAVLTNGIVIRAIAAALANQQGVGGAKDTERLDWLDAQNLQQRMGWKVSQAPAGNVSVQHVVFLGSEPVPIRAAIDAAMSTQPAESNQQRAES